MLSAPDTIQPQVFPSIAESLLEAEGDVVAPSAETHSTACDSEVGHASTRSSAASSYSPELEKHASALNIPWSAETYPVIPPEHAARTVVLCFGDGASDQSDLGKSNVMQLYSILKKDESDKQMVYYQPGGGAGWNVDAHIKAGYEFLMQSYISNDRICLFGFSRGAYVARSLAGMIDKVGLLPANNTHQIPAAYRLYKRDDSVGRDRSAAFKRAYAIDVKVEFVGVWDSANSVKRRPFAASPAGIHTFRQAVSLDERRATFKSDLWHRPDITESKPPSSNTIQARPPPAPSPLSPLSPPRSPSPVISVQDADQDSTHNYHYRRRSVIVKQRSEPAIADGTVRRKRSARRPQLQWAVDDEPITASLASTHGADQTRPTDVEEVWFAGCHSDVGGVAQSTSTRHSLGRIPLRWMIRECFKANTGIMFHSDRLKEIGLDPSTLYPFVTSRPTPRYAPGLQIQAIPRTRRQRATDEIRRRTAQNAGMAASKLGRVRLPRRERAPPEMKEAPSPSVAEETTVQEDKRSATSRLSGPIRRVSYRAGQKAKWVTSHFKHVYVGDLEFDPEEIAPASSTAEPEAVEEKTEAAQQGDQTSPLRRPLKVKVYVMAEKAKQIASKLKRRRNEDEPILLSVHEPNESTTSLSLSIAEEISWPMETEEDEELMDAVAPIFDPLSLKWYWWILEILPTMYRYQNGSNEWVSRVGFNRGRARFIPKQHSNGIKVHRSVKIRMEAEDAEGKRYVPRAMFLVDPTWVD